MDKLSIGKMYRLNIYLGKLGSTEEIRKHLDQTLNGPERQQVEEITNALTLQTGNEYELFLQTKAPYTALRRCRVYIQYIGKAIPPWSGYWYKLLPAQS